MDESRSKNGNARRSQKSVRSNTTETRNSFEPLQRINEALEEARNEDNHTANNDDRRFRRPSCRPTDVTTQRTNQSVSTESTRKCEQTQTQPNSEKKVMIAGDSVLKHLQEGGKGGVTIPFHAQILTKFTRHAQFKQNFTNHEIQHK